MATEYGGRALRNAFFDRWAGRKDELAGDDAATVELRAARKLGDFDVTAIYAGQGVALLSAERAAADILSELAGAEGLLDWAAGRSGGPSGTGDHLGGRSGQTV